MGNGLTVPYLYDRAMEGRRTVGNPVTGFRCKRVGVPCRQIRRAELKRESEGAPPKLPSRCFLEKLLSIGHANRTANQLRWMG